MLKDPIIQEARELQPELIRLRRDFHQYPEIGYAVHRTAGICARLLKNLQCSVKTGVNQTGITSLLTGTGKGPCLLLRADMDALPIQEENDKPYASQNPGIMHACGHDAHTAMLLGAAKLLCRRRSAFKGSVKFIFQPNEEIVPGGAIGMIKEGVMEDPSVNAAFALHVDPGLESGKIGIKEGPFMAGVDTPSISIFGKSSHASQPHLGVDGILAAAYTIIALQALVSRPKNPLDSLIVSLTQINGGKSHNTLADQVNISGTVRTLNPQLRKRVPTLMRRVIKSATHALGADFHLDYHFGNPPLVNHPRMTDLVIRTVYDMLGADAVVEFPPSMGGEDFAYFLEKVPGCMFRLGIRNEKKGIIHPWHDERFDIDEDILPIGSALLTAIALQYLNRLS